MLGKGKPINMADLGPVPSIYDGLSIKDFVTINNGFKQKS